LVQRTAKAGYEPKPEVTKSCYVRAQPEKCRERTTHGAAARQ